MLLLQVKPLGSSQPVLSKGKAWNGRSGAEHTRIKALLLFPRGVRAELAHLWLLNNKQLLRRSSPASMPGLCGVLGSRAMLVCGLWAGESSGCKREQPKESSRRRALFRRDRAGNQDLSSASK